MTEENQHLLPEKDLAEWEEAIDEYEAHQGNEELAEDDENEWFYEVTDAVYQQKILGLDQLLSHDLTTGEMPKSVS